MYVWTLLLHVFIWFWLLFKTIGDIDLVISIHVKVYVKFCNPLCAVLFKLVMVGWLSIELTFSFSFSFSFGKSQGLYCVHCSSNANLWLFCCLLMIQFCILPRLLYELQRRIVLACLAHRQVELCCMIGNLDRTVFPSSKVSLNIFTPTSVLRCVLSVSLALISFWNSSLFIVAILDKVAILSNKTAFVPQLKEISECLKKCQQHEHDHWPPAARLLHSL